jgi:hypothetical protein
MIRKTREFEQFRDKLSGNQLDNLRAHLVNALAEGGLKHQGLTVLELGAGVKFHVYAGRDKGLEDTWLLGGHWVRRGEPSAEFLRRMRQYAERISRGEAPE